jgi:hypothetical protein
MIGSLVGAMSLAHIQHVIRIRKCSCASGYTKKGHLLIASLLFASTAGTNSIATLLEDRIVRPSTLLFLVPANSYRHHYHVNEK